MVPDRLGPIRNALEFKVLFVKRTVALIAHQKGASSDRYSIDGCASHVYVLQSPRIFAIGVVNAGNARCCGQLLRFIRGCYEDSVFGDAKSKVRQHGWTKGVI